MGNYRTILQEGNHVAGHWLTAGEEELEVIDKYNGELLALLPMAYATQMEQAIATAEAVRPALQLWNAGQRAAQLTRLADLLELRREDFVDLIVREAGKPIGYARTELARGISTLRLAAGEATRFVGEIVPMDFEAGIGKTAMTKRFPIGVVAGITPFNFPLNLVLHKVAPALAVGCPIIIKPAPQAPLTALALAALVREAGYPAGAVQVLVCSNVVAELLVTDPRIAMLSFTGSDAIGWHLKGLAGKKKVALELGGNAAVIVDETADLKNAARTIAIGAYLYAGQVCISTQRIYVVDAVYAAFEELLLAEIALLKSGNPLEDGVLNGPLIDAGHLARIDAWVQEALQGGAELLAGGKVLSLEHHLYAPTLLSQTMPDMKVNHDEVFGPVAVLERTRDFQDAIDKVNNSRYGLQAGVFTNRIDHLKMAFAQLEVGGVIINNPPGFRMDGMPYGGVKDSGLGREGLRYAMEEMTELRLLVY
jgi:acyl-CoA reductase-like NAD-dependent aldehyde dehydrogenase